MSQLQRLNIFGIRSFGPEEQDLQKIKFFSPLTLIQGQNGCGKTTIIEAIKFAITGELPSGTASGQGFVYDPKLAKNFKTRGQVKLRVSDTKGEWVTVTKTVEVTQKHSKMEFKRVDSTIARGRPGQSEHISGKCVDVDNEMCLCLGVSKPILNNVIFCHQENSNWPLEEGKKLKEKFDEIFDATQYNKCLIMITKFVKQGLEKQRNLQMQVSNLLDVKKCVQKKRELLQEKEEKLKSLVEEINENNTKLKVYNRRLREVNEIELNFSKLCAEIEIKKKDIENLVEQEDELLENIKEFDGTDNELQDKINLFEQDLQNLQIDIDVLSAKKQDIENIEKSLRQKINENQLKIGSLQGEEKQNKIKIESRNKLLKKSVKELELKNEVEDNISDDQVKSIMTDLNEKLENKKINVKLIETTMEANEKKLQDDIDKIREEFAKIKQNIVLKNKNISDSKDELRKIQHEIEALNSAGNQLKLSDNKLNRLNKELTSLDSSVNVDELRSKVESEKKKQKELEDRLTSVDSEVQILQQFTSLQTELDLKNELLVNKESELQKYRNKHEKSLNHIFDNNIPNFNLKKGVESFQIAQNKTIKDLTNQINEKTREVLKVESNLQTKKEKLTNIEEEFNENQKELALHCEDKELEDIIEETQQSMKNLQNDRGIYFSSKYIYQKFIKTFQNENPCCPVCKRNVDEKTHVNTIISDLSKKIENVPNELQKIDKKITEQNKKYETLLSLKPISEKYLKLKSEIPEIKTQIEKYDKDFRTAKDVLEKLKNDILTPQSNEKMAQVVIADVALIDQLQKDIQIVKQEISSLELRMPKNESNRGIQEALSEQDTLKIDLKTSRSNVESFQNKLSQHIERVQRLKEQKNELVTQQLKIKQSLQGKDNLITKSTEIESKLVELQSEIQDLDIQQKASKKSLDESIQNKETLKQKNKIEMNDVRTKFNNLQKIIQNILDYQKDIDKFIQKDVITQIDNIQDKISKIKSDLEECTVKKSKIDSNVDDLKSQISGSRINFRELQDNVNLRKKRSEKKIIQKELVTLEGKLGDNDISSIRKEKSELIKTETNLQELTHRSEGEKSQLLINIKEIKTELNQPQNAQSSVNYKKKCLEFMLRNKALCDMKQFMKAMDWALMQFHRQRMIQVNNIIKDLWRTIYKGNDIDYIEIKTDDLQTVGTDKRKIYNYRIVQVKNEAELDMRGRCSAGQRVLASLIIRIALSETFSNNCGILTLDEPTTNLDRENIHSLCEALIELIQQKRQQKNFQIIIITHDQDFVERLTRTESLEQYYVIKRNEYGKSVISLKR